MTNYFIDQIEKNHKISSYLSAQGINPRRDSDGKMVYNCPMPGHSKDNTPSFYVYDKGDHEDYYCYGCKSGGSIVQIVAGMEQISLRDAISKLSLGLDIDLSDVIDHVLREIIAVTGGEDTSAETVLQMVMYISTVCHDYLKRVNFEPSEIGICDKLHIFCDNLMKSRDRKSLQEIIDLIPLYLGRRYESWATKKENEEHENMTAWQV
jgi:hypothetical protein